MMYGVFTTMAKKIEPDSAEEYTYTEDQPVEAYPLKSPGIMSTISGKISQHKPLLTGVGIVLVIYIAFKIMGLISAHKSEIKKITPTKAAVVINDKHAAPPFFQPQTKSVAQPNHSTELSSQLQDNIATIDQRLNNVQQSLGNIDASLQRLENLSAQQLYIQQQENYARLNATRKKAVAMYHVQSIIPNRAWLTTARGNTLTVTIGTYIPGAGIVTAIDSVNGNVTTNLGITIQYSLADQ